MGPAICQLPVLLGYLSRRQMDAVDSRPAVCHQPAAARRRVLRRGNRRTRPGQRQVHRPPHHRCLRRGPDVGPRSQRQGRRGRSRARCPGRRWRCCRAGRTRGIPGPHAILQRAAPAARLRHCQPGDRYPPGGPPPPGKKQPHTPQRGQPDSPPKQTPPWACPGSGQHPSAGPAPRAAARCAKTVRRCLPCPQLG